MQSQRAIITPNQTAIKPAITLVAIYNRGMTSSPADRRLKDSKEKVENVVNPPQKPTMRAALSLGSVMPDLLIRPSMIPKRKHPIIFMVKVARGNGAFQITRNNLLIKNRQQVPINPPHPAKNISFHISIEN